MSEELKPCPMCGGPAEMDTLRGYRRWSDGSVGNAIAVYCTECTLEISVCRDDVPDIEPEQVAEMWNRRAQPAAPSVCSSCDGTGKISGLPCAWCMQSAAPSVAPEPVAWTTLIEIDWVKRNAGRAGSFYAVKAGPNDIPLFAHPPRAPLTEEQKRDLVKECDLDWQRGFMPLFDGDPTNRYAVLIEAVEAAHGIGGK